MGADNPGGLVAGELERSDLDEEKIAKKKLKKNTKNACFVWLNAIIRSRVGGTAGGFCMVRVLVFVAKGFVGLLGWACNMRGYRHW